jgi:hypothetical protein
MVPTTAGTRNSATDALARAFERAKSERLVAMARSVADDREAGAILTVAGEALTDTHSD